MGKKHSDILQIFWFIITFSIILLGIEGLTIIFKPKTEIILVDMVEFLKENGVKPNSCYVGPGYCEFKGRISNNTDTQDDINVKIKSSWYEEQCSESYVLVDFHGVTIYPDCPRRNSWGNVIATNRQGLIRAKECGIEKIYIDSESGLVLTDAQLSSICYLARGGEIYGNPAVPLGDDTIRFSPTAFIPDSQAISQGETVISPVLVSGGCKDSTELIPYSRWIAEYREEEGKKD